MMLFSFPHPIKLFSPLLILFVYPPPIVDPSPTILFAIPPAIVFIKPVISFNLHQPILLNEPL